MVHSFAQNDLFDGPTDHVFRDHVYQRDNSGGEAVRIGEVKHVAS